MMMKKRTVRVKMTSMQKYNKIKRKKSFPKR